MQSAYLFPTVNLRNPSETDPLGRTQYFGYNKKNGEVPLGKNVNEDGNIVDNGGNTPPGLNRREKAEKPENPNKPEKTENSGTEDSSDKKTNKAQQGIHIYTYDELNRMVTSDISKVESSYTYDTLGNLIYEKEKNVKTDYQYNELNQLVSRKQGNESYAYSYDKRGNRIAETGKKETREYVYDETNHLVEGTNWKGDKSAYTYNGLDVRINNTQTAHSGSVYSRDYVIDYTSLERDDLMIFAEGDGQLDYVQREVYAGSERIEQFTDRSNGGYERLLYVHEDLMGNTRYYTKANGQSYAELTYDAWGMPESPNKLLNNDHGNYVYATYTGHIFDTTLDIYFAEARFYDANTRTWLAMDPIKDGGNWYQYCNSNPVTYWDPTGLEGFSLFGCNDSLMFSLESDADVMLMLHQESQRSYNIGSIAALLKINAEGINDTVRIALAAFIYPPENRNRFLELTSGDVIRYENVAGLAGDQNAFYKGVRDASNLMKFISILETLGGIAAIGGGIFGGGAAAVTTGGLAIPVAISASGEAVLAGVALTVNGATTYNKADQSLDEAKEKLNEIKEKNSSEKKVTNSAGQEVTRKYVKNQDELLKKAEEAAGGNLDDFIETKPGWYQNKEGTIKIEWNTEGHITTNEGPHVTVRHKNDRGGWTVVEKYFIEGNDYYK